MSDRLGAGGRRHEFRPHWILDGVANDPIDLTQRIAVEVEKLGAKFIDAPMTRTPKEAAEGRLNLTVGGEREVFETVKPLLQCYAENIVFAGPVGSGHQLKLIHNFVSLGFSAVLAEAAACAERAEIPLPNPVRGEHGWGWSWAG